MHSNKIFVALACTMLVVVAACNFDSTEPDIAFTNDRVPAVDSSASYASVFGNSGGLLVGGTITTPSSCYKLAPKISQGSASITITINASLGSGCTNTELSAYSYSLITTGYRAGQYQVRVIHAFENNIIPAKTVVDEPVTIS